MLSNLKLWCILVFVESGRIPRIEVKDEYC